MTKHDLNKRLLSLLLAGSIVFNTTSCSKDNGQSKIDEDIAVEEVNNRYISNEDKKILKEYIKNGIYTDGKKIYDDYYKVTSMYAQDIKDTDKFGDINSIMKSFNFDNVYSHSEFKSFLGNVNVTWEDVIDSINHNSYLDKNIKDILIIGINNLDKSVYNYDLSVLNYNMSKLKVEYIDYNVVEGIDDAGSFNPFDKTIRIQKDMIYSFDFNTLIIHELLGHGSEETIYEDDEKRIYITNCPLIIVPTDKYETSFINRFGLSFSEYFADRIAVDATKKKLIIGAGYQANVYYANILLNALDGDINRLVNEGVQYIIDLAKSKGILYPENYIIDNDTQTTYSQYVGSTNGSGKTKYFTDALTYLVASIVEAYKQSGMSNEEIENKLLDAAKSNDKYMEYYEGKGVLTFTNYGQASFFDKYELYNFISDYSKKNYK